MSLACDVERQNKKASAHDRLSRFSGDAIVLSACTILGAHRCLQKIAVDLLRFVTQAVCQNDLPG